MNTQKKTAKGLSKERQAKLSELSSVASQIRYLDAEGLARGDISRELSEFLGKTVRYQWVRNVLETKLKKTD